MRKASRVRTKHNEPDSVYTASDRLEKADSNLFKKKYVYSNEDQSTLNRIIKDGANIYKS